MLQHLRVRNFMITVPQKKVLGITPILIPPPQNIPQYIIRSPLHSSFIIVLRILFIHRFFFWPHIIL